MSAVPASLPSSSPWRSAWSALLLVHAIILLLYHETAAAMVSVWLRSDTFTHAFLVLPISLWLVWRQRGRLAALAPEPNPWFLAALLATAGAWLAGEVILVNAPTQFALVTMLILAVPAVVGLQVARAILFPLLFLFFAVPFGEFMVPQMMEWTADFVVSALRLTGVPVYRDGLMFVIPTGTWSVVTECSGVRYLMASFMVGSLFAYLNYNSYRKRALFMLVSILLPILANWLRAYIIVMLGHLSGNKIAAGVDHILYGWVFFGVVIFIMFMVGSRWADPDPQDDRAPALPVAGTGTGRPVLLMAALAALIVALPQAALWTLQRADAGAASPTLDLPAALAPGWSRVSPPETGWTPEWLNPSAAVHEAYVGPDGSVGVHVFYYRHQNAERKLVSSLNRVLAQDDRGLVVRSSGMVESPAGPDGSARFRAASLQPPSTREGSGTRPPIVAWQVYWVDGRFVAGELPAKLANASARLRGRGDDGASLVIYAAAPQSEASRSALKAFVEANLGRLNDMLQRTRSAR